MSESAVRKPKVRYLLRHRCPLCGDAPVYRSWWHVNERCAACDWKFYREPGYFLGSIYLNYGLTTVLVSGLYVLFEFVFGWPLWLSLLVCGVVVVAFPLWFLRYARSAWMWIDLSLDSPPALPEAARDPSPGRTPSDPASSADTDPASERPTSSA